MKIRSSLIRAGAVAAKSLCCLSIAMFACEAHAGDTFVDGNDTDGVAFPDVFHTATVADFETGTQGWGNTRVGGIEANGGVLQNSNPLGANNETDTYVFVDVPNSLLSGDPDTFTVGELPGQYDILQFDLRFDNLPPNTAAARGRQFLQNGGGPVHGLNFYGAAADIPDLPLDNDFHTYTIKRAPTDSSWNQNYSRIRIDVVDGVSVLADLNGTNFSLDNVQLGRSTATAAFPVVEPAIQNLIRNGDLSDTSNVVMNGENSNAFNINGGNGNFGPFRGNTGDVDHWTPFNNNPNSIVEAVADGGALDLANTNGNNTGSFYLDTHWSTGAEQFSLNSAGGYLNGLTQTDILAGVAIDETATYEFGFNINFNEARVSNPDSNFKVALTLGANETDANSAGAISIFDEQLSDIDISTDTRQVVSISGATLKAAQDSGAPVNLIVQSLADTDILNFPSGTPVPNNHVDGFVFTQVQLDNLDLTKSFSISTGDVNKDGFVTQADVNLAQAYLDGNGGETAAQRQNDLAAAPSSPSTADILASLNLADFDLTGNDFFDADDVAAILALVGPSGPGDFDGDGDADIDDINLLSANLGLPASTNPAMNLDDDDTITLADHDLHITTQVSDANGVGALIGDLNLDGDVDVSEITFVNGQVVNNGDASQLLANLGTQTGALYADGDLNGDGDVDISQITFVNGQVVNLGDASRLLANLGESTVAAPAGSAVPEPGSMTLLTMAGIGAAMRRRKR